MVTYTIQSARFNTDDNSVAILTTAEVGEVLISQQDTPELWAAMLAWGTPDAYAEPPAPPPTIVSASQAKIALYNAGLLEQVKALVGAHPYEPVRIWYADANQWESGHAYVQALGAELDLTTDDIAALFLAASLL